jgi:hypothetical protein
MKSLAWAAVVMIVGGVAAAGAPPPAQPAAPSIGALIRQLGDADYPVRQKAHDELARLRYEAFDPLMAATSDDDLEIAARARALLKLLRAEWLADDDAPEARKFLRDYESDDARARQARMKSLAELPEGKGTAALCRLVRFESSLRLSKAAAAALLTARIAAPPPDAATAETVRTILKECRRPGAAWLLAWTRLGAEPDAVMAEWDRFAADEQALPRSERDSAGRDVAVSLIQFQIVRLKQLGKSDDAVMAAARPLVEIESVSVQRQQVLLEWLIDQKLWNVVDEVAERFAASFTDSSSLYKLAQAYAGQHKEDLAEAFAGRAFRLARNKNDMNSLNQHFTAGLRLWQWGQFSWARREFEFVIGREDGPPAANDPMRGIRQMAQTKLAEMLHDQGQDLEAATVLQEPAADPQQRLAGRPANMACRMNYYLACHWATKSDAARQREFLDKALDSAGITDVDVLAACHALPGQTAEYRDKIAQRVRQAAENLRTMANRSSNDPNSRVMLARLLAGTGGDLDEALYLAQRAVALNPKFDGCHAALAAVYAARGDWANAVASQVKAAEAAPYSGLVQRQLDLYGKKLREKKP